MSAPFMITASGRRVQIIFPTPEMIDIRDIAHHLALTNRFNGATSLPYSVAQHSCFVARIMLACEADPREALYGLLHDAHEAYLGDLIRPVKIANVLLFNAWTCLEDFFDAVIHRRFGLPDPDTETCNFIKQADDRALAAEWRDLMPGLAPFDYPPAPYPVRPVNWAIAEEQFLTQFEKLARLAGLNP